MTYDTASGTPPKARGRGHIIVIGNEKGGSGKTTTTMHLIVALLRLGFRIGTLDIDARQRSLTRYLENRKATATREATPLPMPHHIVVQKSPFDLREEAEADERDRLTRALAKLLVTCDFVLIDSPGNDTYLSRLSHSFADTVITPINDSFVDLDVLASVDGGTLAIQRPSIYSEMLWEQKMQRAKRDGGSIDWVVMRNRLSNIDARNKRQITKVCEDLSKRLGFRLAPGFSERVIFREMFLQGLTVLDVMDTSNSHSVSMSHLAARQEVRELLKTLRIPAIDQRISEVRTGDHVAEVATTTANAISETDAPPVSAPQIPASSSPAVTSIGTPATPATFVAGSAA
jgi:chromosome partitioning protein